MQLKPLGIGAAIAAITDDTDGDLTQHEHCLTVL